MACHQVCQRPERLGVVAIRSDVYVDSAHVARVALRTCMPELPYQFLQVFDVLVGKDRGHHLAGFFLPCCPDAGIPLEFPFPALRVPSAPCPVAVPSCGVFASPGSEEGGSNLGCLASCDPVHLDLNSDRLLLHGFDSLLCILHGFASFGLCAFLFACVLITLKGTYIQSIRRCISHKIQEKKSCILALFLRAFFCCFMLCFLRSIELFSFFLVPESSVSGKVLHQDLPSGLEL